MLLLEDVERQCARQGRNSHKACIAWTNDGRAFVITDQDELVNSFLPRTFPKTKFSSFTRKLYRWGFRQMGLNESKKGSGCPKIFAHDLFRRDNKQLMAHMQSTTAEGARRAQSMLQTDPVLPSLSSQQHDEFLNTTSSRLSNMTTDRRNVDAASLFAPVTARVMPSQLMPSNPVAMTPNVLQSLQVPREVVGPQSQHDYLTTGWLSSAYPSQFDLALLSNPAIIHRGANNLLVPPPHPPLNNALATYRQSQYAMGMVGSDQLLTSYLGGSILPSTAESARFNQALGSILSLPSLPLNFDRSLGDNDDTLDTQQRFDFRGLRWPPP